MGCKILICTGLQVEVANEYLASVARFFTSAGVFFVWRPTPLDQSLTARTGATIVGHASRLGGYVQ
jgi:hypothetical protein